MRLRNKQQILTVAPEEKPPARTGARIARILYFMFLAGIGAYLIFYAAGRTFHAEAQGFVEPEKVYVRTGVGGLVNRMLVEPDQKVIPA